VRNAETNEIANQVLYQNTDPPIYLKFDRFPEAIGYCTITYTVHLFTFDGTEQTWNRELNPDTHDPPYAWVEDSMFSDMEPSDELLSIRRPTDTEVGLVQIYSSALTAFPGSYIL